jgi:tRNA uridine 5-carboxymethylaminomethyl modification enzyme
VQKRVLNRSKGPAVWALRAQTDKHEYAREMRAVLEAQPDLEIREAMAVGVQVGGVAAGGACGGAEGGGEGGAAP